MRYALAVLLLLGAARPAGDPALAAMDVMIQQEYRSAAEYARLQRDFGAVAPFAGYVEVEQGHAELIGFLYRDRGLPVPPDHWDVGAVAPHRVLSAACAALMATENEVVGRYDGFLEDRALPGDVRRVFRHNRNVASISHVPELRMCSLRDVRPR
jgi:hypothetical protein